MNKYMRGCHDAMTHVFTSGYMQVRTSENSTELYKIAEDTVILQQSLHLCQQPSSTCDCMHSCPVKVALPLQPLVYEVYRLTIRVFRRTKPVKIQCCGGKTVGWVGQHCPYRSYQCAHVCGLACGHARKGLKTFFFWDELDKGDHSDFLVFQYSGQSSVLLLYARSVQ